MYHWSRECLVLVNYHCTESKWHFFYSLPMLISNVRSASLWYPVFGFLAASHVPDSSKHWQHKLCVIFVLGKARWLNITLQTVLAVATRRKIRLNDIFCSFCITGFSMRLIPKTTVALSAICVPAGSDHCCFDRYLFSQCCFSSG